MSNKTTPLKAPTSWDPKREAAPRRWTCPITMGADRIVESPEPRDAGQELAEIILDRRTRLMAYNAEGGFPPVLQPIAPRTAIFLLNVAVRGSSIERVVSWATSMTTNLAQRESALVLFNSDVALAHGLALPRQPGLTLIAEGVHLVTRRWTARNSEGAPVMLLLGPTSAPGLDRFHGSLWSQDLLGRDDIALCEPTRSAVADFDFEARTAVGSSAGSRIGSPWTADTTLPQQVLERVRPQTLWCRSAPDLGALRGVPPGQMVAISL